MVSWRIYGEEIIMTFAFIENKRRECGPWDRFALIFRTIFAFECLGYYKTRQEAEEAQMREYDPDNLEIIRLIY